MMNRNTRSSLLALFASGLLVLGVTGCLDQDESAAGEQSTEGEETAAEGFTGILSGEVEYLAPGEYIINDQAFYVGEDTQVLAGVYACVSETSGVDENGAGTTECALEEFEAELEAETVVLAEAEIANGVAETITEYETDSHLADGGSDGSDGSDDSAGGSEESAEESAEEGTGEGTEDGGGSEDGDENEEVWSNGYNGTLSGEVVYLAPGKYIVNDQAFFIGESTTILSGLYACPAEGDSHVENGSGTLPCDFDTFDAALQEGTVVLAEVVVSGGVAESITEYAA